MNATCNMMLKPLFCDGMFNRTGKKMRAVFCREISNGENVFRIYRKDGKQDNEYPRAETDKYLLYVEQNSFLIPLRCTEYQLINDCGFMAAMNELYGGMEGRAEYFNNLRSDSDPCAIDAAIARENELISSIGQDPKLWADRIQAIFNIHIERYLKSKNTNGKSFPDFCGACILNELNECIHLSEIYKRVQEEKEAMQRAEQEAEEQRCREEANKKAEQKALDAIRIIKNGGKLSNDAVTFYKQNGDCVETSIVPMLMRRYGVNVPIRTQGWINEKLVSVTVENTHCDTLTYKRYKNATVSQKFFECMNDLIQRVNNMK